MADFQRFLLGALTVASVLFSPRGQAQSVSFIARRDFDLGLFRLPVSVAAGDFNRDGVVDLAFATSGSNDVAILLGNGDGTSQVPRNFAAGRLPWSVAVADFNGDGLLDLAVANADSDDVSVLLGNGDGSFQTPLNFGAGARPTSVVVADVNGDGLPDMIVANNRSNDISVLINASR